MLLVPACESLMPGRQIKANFPLEMASTLTHTLAQHNFMTITHLRDARRTTWTPEDLTDKSHPFSYPNHFLQNEKNLQLPRRPKNPSS